MNLKIKTCWLLSSIFYFSSLLFDTFSYDPYLTFKLTFFSLTFLIPFGYLFIESLNFVGLFWFSYKRNGTTLLTMNMVLSVIRMTLPLFLIYYYLTEGRPLRELLSVALYFIVILQWFLLSFKVRNRNKLVRTNEILAHPDHQQLLQELQAIDNLDELYLKYGTSVRNHPYIASTLKKIYKQRRVDLSKP